MLLEKLFHRSNKVDGVIALSPCKSICIRTLVLQFLNGKPLSPVPDDAPADVVTTHAALATIQQHLEDGDAEVKVDAHDCGAAYRFLTAVLAITPGKWWLTGSERLLQRPISSLVKALQSIGAEISETTDGLHIQGKQLHAEEIAIDGSESSQYISALLLIAKKIGNPEIKYDKSQQRSLTYVRMTETIIRQFYAGDEVAWEKDWSAAIFWYAYVVLGGAKSLLLKDLQLPSLQGDAIIAQWFNAFGASTKVTAEGVVIRKEHENLLEEATLDVRQHIDLAPVLVAMASMMPMKLTLTGVQNLNLKESKRKDFLVQDLQDVATIFSPDEDTLIVEGHPQKVGELHLSSHQDHRLVMAYRLLALRHKVIIDNADCVDKSYPGFEKDLSAVSH